MKSKNEQLGHRIGSLLVERNWVLGTAESCTGGLLAGAITDVAGSSAWFEEGLVTYANSSKSRLLGVSNGLLVGDGAVSREVVEAMVSGVINRGAQVAVATSGIAGPDGGTKDKPVGTVWFAWSLAGQVSSEVQCFSGDRAQVREQSVRFALEQLLSKLETQNAG